MPAGYLLYKEVCGSENGYLYVVALEGEIIFGMTETAWLYRYRIMDDGSLVDMELVVEFDAVDHENLDSFWLQDGWLYFTVKDRATEEMMTYRLRIDGTVWEEVA